MKQQIRRFADDLAVGLRHGGQGQFQAFFADLLRDAGESCVDEFCGVAAFGPRGDSLRHDLFEGSQKGEILSE